MLDVFYFDDFFYQLVNISSVFGDFLQSPCIPIHVHNLDDLAMLALWLRHFIDGISSIYDCSSIRTSRNTDVMIWSICFTLKCSTPIRRICAAKLDILDVLDLLTCSPYRFASGHLVCPIYTFWSLVLVILYIVYVLVSARRRHKIDCMN